MHLLKSICARALSQLPGRSQSSRLTQPAAIPRFAARLMLSRHSSPSAAPRAEVACGLREFVEPGLDSQVTCPALDDAAVRKLAGSLRRRDSDSVWPCTCRRRHFKEASPATTFPASSAAVAFRCLKGPSTAALCPAISLSSSGVSPDSTILGAGEGAWKARYRPSTATWSMWRRRAEPQQLRQ